MKTRLNPRLLVLALATFAIGTDTYVIAASCHASPRALT